MAGSIRKMSSEMGDNHGRLDSSVRIKNRICAEVTSPASIVARYAITLIMRLCTYYTITIGKSMKTIQQSIDFIVLK